ncbi:MAG: RNA polymerase subunit sigma [Planctomycetes bacterium]|nr:RNA polymerase subunit sigma [Planctomycetota bacterium]
MKLRNGFEISPVFLPVEVHLPDKSTVTRWLEEAKNGNPDAAEQLWNVVYQEVRQMAAGKLSKERQTANLQATMLVSETYMKMWPKDKEPPNFEDRKHFFGSIARVMEHYLIDYARTRGRLKRGGDRKRVSLTIAEGELKNLDTVDGGSLEQLLNALKTLENVMPRAAQVVRLRYISGHTIKQTAIALEVSDRTVVDDWEYARAYLLREISKDNA